jgi:hypothetical protein
MLISNPGLAFKKKVLAAIATTHGFDSGAIQLAKYFGVELWHVKNEQEFVCRVEKAVSVGVADGPCYAEELTVIKS